LRTFVQLNVTHNDMNHLQ